MGFVLTVFKYLGNQSPKCGTYDIVLQAYTLCVKSGKGLKRKIWDKHFVFSDSVQNNIFAYLVLKTLQMGFWVNCLEK